MERPTPVVKMLPQESAEVKGVGVVDHRLGGVAQPVAMGYPALAQLIIFPAGDGESRVEPPQGTKGIGRERQVAGRGEARLIGVGVVIGKEEGDQELARRRIRVVRQRVYGSPGNGIRRRL